MSFQDILVSSGVPPEIARAFDEVPRDLFADPSESISRIFSDVPIVTYKSGEKYSTSSQPSLMAEFMLWVGIERGSRVLEIGGGTGYNAAVMSRIVGEEGLVVSVEYDPDVYSKGARILERLGFKNLIFIRSDGYYGYPDMAPYDSIVCTVGVDEVPVHWMRQLRDGGRIVVPLNILGGGAYQPTFLYERSGDWMKLEYKVATNFLKARGMLGNLNERNLEKLERVRSIPETDRLDSPRSGLELLDILTASIANELGRFYFVGESGYAVWRRYFWEIHGRVDKFIRAFSLIEKAGFPAFETRAYAHTLDRRYFDVVERF